MKWLLAGLTIFICAFLFADIARADVSKLLITEVRLGGGEIIHNSVSYKQYAILHNQSAADIDLSTWRLQYAKADFAGPCQAPTWSNEITLSGVITPGSFAVVPYQLTDNTAGALRVVDAVSVVHDSVGWGTAACFETQPVGSTPANGQSIIRYALCDATYAGADTNNNANDFSISDQPFAVIKSPECQPACAVDQQLIDGVCVDDQCENVDGFQQVVPDGYQKVGADCMLQLLPLEITELLPNVTGSDTGKEFIELHNPHAHPIELRWYVLKIGDKQYALPDELIAAGEFKVFSDDALGLVLPNTSATVTLQTIDGATLYESPAYNAPKDDEAWALVNGSWQFTNRPTPAAANLPSISDEKGNGSVGEDDLKPCAENQYRSPETNRCRRIEVAASELTPCKEGQYRSEETNRCRNSMSAASTLTPCKEGQYRSEETNRCRSITGDTNELTPCKEGQERNPETNRCRTVQAAQPTKADYAVEPIKETATAFTGWWALGGISALAAGKIGWEWREEIANAVRKVGSFFTSEK